jgi:hypothetical protein
VPEFGSGCIAIRISVFQRLTGPFFKIGIDPTKAHQGLGQAMGEDIAFCRAARNKGFRTISREENIRKRITLKRCHFFK